MSRALSPATNGCKRDRGSANTAGSRSGEAAPRILRSTRTTCYIPQAIRI